MSSTISADGRLRGPEQGLRIPRAALDFKPDEDRLLLRFQGVGYPGYVTCGEPERRGHGRAEFEKFASGNIVFDKCVKQGILFHGVTSFPKINIRNIGVKMDT